MECIGSARRKKIREVHGLLGDQEFFECEGHGGLRRWKAGKKPRKKAE